jgi:hypothetical protein
MRVAIAALVSGMLTTPALAQDYLALTNAHDAERVAAEAAARQRDIALTNEVSAMQARAQTEQALNDIAVLRARPTLPHVILDPKAPPPNIDLSRLASPTLPGPWRRNLPRPRRRTGSSPSPARPGEGRDPDLLTQRRVASARRV